MSDVGTWLEAIGLGKHALAFDSHNVTPDLLGELDEGDLKELGLGIGDRKRFRRALSRGPGPPVDEGAERVVARGAQPASSHVERRRLTVVFVDLVGSTALSSRLDPERWSDILRDYQNVVAGLVTRFDGHVAQFLGDGVLCFFGWPKAMEDAAERAVEAALEVIRDVKGVRAAEGRLACRVGISTGPVVVGELLGDGTGGDESAVGEVLNFAARLQALADPNQVLISGETRRLIGNAFLLTDLGRRSLKGIPGERTVFAVLGSDPEHDRFAGRAGMRAGPLIGREEELALLLEKWKRAEAGEGQVICVVGEAGIGKSRLCHALFDHVAADRCERISFQCSPYLRDTALWPAINRLTAAAGIAEPDSPQLRLEKLEHYLCRNDRIENTKIGLIAELLGLDPEPRYGPIGMAPSARRRATLSVLASHVVDLSHRAPTLVLLEDAHWADPTTLDLVAELVERTCRERVMLLLTTRPGTELALPERTEVITLNRLGHGEAAEIVARLGAGRLASATVEAIIERTDGVPLFVEELTKAMLESGDMSVPASLHDTLMSRLDRLPEVKEVAQTASVFGREFDAKPVARVVGQSLRRVLDALRALCATELVHQRAGAGDGFSFKHALVRDAAYESLLHRRRQELHGRIFDVLREGHDALPAVLAQHAAEAGRYPEAVRYGRIAAVQALRRPAYAEALSHLDTALGLLGHLSPGPGVTEERKRLLRLRGQGQIARFGYANPETVATFAEIEAIARETEDRSLLVDGLYGRWAGSYVPGRLPAALEIAESVCDASEGTDDSLARALGQRLRGTVLTMMGRTDEALEALDRAAALYDPARHRSEAFRFGQDVGTAGRCYRLGVLVAAGRLDTAAALAREVLVDLDGIPHAHTKGYALGHLALFLSAGEILPLGSEVAEQCLALSDRDGMPLWAALGRASHGIARLHDGRPEDALPELEHALETLRTFEFLVFLPLLLPFHAIALGRTGDVAGGMRPLGEARTLIAENGACYAEAIVLTAEGELSELAGDVEEAEAACRHAIERARAMGHLRWELAAIEKLAALRAQLGHEAEAQNLLGSVVARFAEGRAMAPLARAAAASERASRPGHR